MAHQRAVRGLQPVLEWEDKLSRKPGKYDHVVGDLPRIIGDPDDPRAQARVEAEKDKLRAEPLFEAGASALARRYIALRAEKAQAAAALSEVNTRLEAVSQMMFDQYEVEGVKALTVDGHSVTCRLVPYPKMEDKEAFRQWCLGVPDLARQMVLHAGTAKTIINDMLAAGEELPPGVGVWAKQGFRLGSE